MLSKHDLEGLTVSHVLDLLENGRIGHGLAMEWLHLDSYAALVETMHANGRTMPGHRPMRIAKETLDLIKRIARPQAPRAAARQP